MPVSGYGYTNGAIVGNLTINPGAAVYAFNGWSLGYGAGSPTPSASGNCVNSVNIDNGALHFTGAAYGGGTSASNITMSGGTIATDAGGSFDWYDGLTDNPTLTTIASSTPAVISGELCARLASTGAITFNVAKGAVPGGVDLLVSGGITTNSPYGGGGGIVKSGAGLLSLTGSNSYSGNTTVSAGTLKVANAAGSATGSGAVTVDAGATLSGAGIIGGPLEIAGELGPGDSPEILTVNNQVTFEPGSAFNAEVAGTTAGSGYDQLTTTGPVSLAGSLNLTFGTFTPTAHDMLFLINNTGLGATSGTFQYADNSEIGSFDGFNWYITYEANDAATPSLTGGNDVAIYTVPEPATLALLAVGAIALLGCAWRQRRVTTTTRDLPSGT